MNFNKLTIEEKFGQMIVLGLDTYEINDEIIEMIEKYKIGGVVLYKKNYTSLETMMAFINRLKKINKKNKVPLFIAVDQENGRVNRFPKEILQLKSALKQAKTKNHKLCDMANEITAYLLSSVGVNMNFAPDLDIVRSEKNKGIGNRSYGSTKEDVIKYGIPFMQKMQSYNIVSVCKHFPGHGATNIDSHFVIPKIKNLKSLYKEDMNVFKKAIECGCDAIMVGHLKVKGYGFKPATLNKKIIDDLLIKGLNYNGLIVTDDLKMNYLRCLHATKKNIIRSIDAGHNLIMVKYAKGDNNRVYKKLWKKLKNCEIDLDLVNNSARKIYDIKNKYDISDRETVNKIDIIAVNEQIKKINNIIDKTLGDF